MSTKPACFKPIGGDLGVREFPGPRPVGEVLRERCRVHHLLGELVRAAKVGPAAALRVQPAAGSQRLEDAGEERRMILDPVKRRRAEHQVGPVRQTADRAATTCANETREPSTGRRLARAVISMFHERSIAMSRPLRQPLHQLAGQPAAAAAGVDGALVAVERAGGSGPSVPSCVCGPDTL